MRIFNHVVVCMITQDDIKRRTDEKTGTTWAEIATADASIAITLPAGKRLVIVDEVVP